MVPAVGLASSAESSDHSINDFIPPGTLEYTICDEALDALLQIKKTAILVKRDLFDAFGHIPVAKSDRSLLGFFWDCTVPG